MVHEIEDWLKIHGREEVEVGEDPSQSAPPPMAPDDALSYLIEHTRTEKDFPILRQSAVSLMQLPDSGSVIDAADIVLQDQVLTANILRVANSVYFNRSDRKIDSVSRAITILGLDLVRNTCLGLGYAEAHDKRHPEVEIRKLSAKAFFAATLARELAVAKRHRNPEEVFTGALLHNLPHMALAYLLPEVHLYVQRLLEEGKASPDEAERRALTVPLTKVGISMAVQWHLPNVLLEAIGADESHTTTAARSPTAVTRVAAFLANAIAANILSEASPTDELEKLLDGLDRSLGLVRETAISIIQQAHQRAIKFGQSFGIDWKSFEPTARASVDSERDTDTLRDGLVCALQQQLDTTPDG